MIHKFSAYKLVPIEIECEYSAYGAVRGYRNSMGVPEEPDEPAHIEIEGYVNAETGETVDFDNLVDEEGQPLDECDIEETIEEQLASRDADFDDSEKEY